MRKFLFLLLSFFIVNTIFAQDGVVTKNLKSVKTDLSKMKPLDRPVVLSAKSFYIPTGTPIGMTNYDLQTNASSSNRLIARDNGTISAVWTQYHGTAPATAPQRGSGYNYFNGTSWQFTTFSGNVRVEGSTRTGWPTLMTNGTTEFLASHVMTSPGIYGYTQGIGASNSTWTNDNISGGPEAMLWPRSAYSGDNFYVIGVDNYDVEQTEIDALHFYKSTDAGVNWTYKGEMPNYNTYYHHGQGDTYAMDARDNYVAVVNFADFGDIVLWKSEDFGETWDEIIINDFPVDAYNTAAGAIIDMDEDGAADTCYTADNTGDVVIDSEGKVHVSFSRMRYLDEDALNDDYSWFPYTDWCFYWNEDMGEGLFTGVSSPGNVDMAVSELVDTIGWSPDINLNGTWDFAEVESGEWPFGTYFCSLTSFSNLAVDENDNIYAIFSTVMEGDNYIKTNAVPNAQSFRAVFLTIRDHVTGIWSDPIDITSVDGTNAENVFPELSKYVGADNKLHLYVQWDNEPGCILKETTDPVTNNYIVYKAIDLDGLAVTFNVDMTDSIASGYFVEDVDELWLAGTMNEWTKPGEDAAYEMTESATPDIYTVTISGLAAGDYAYKYFKIVGGTPSWDNGEWTGGDDRVFSLVDTDIELNDQFGRNVGIYDISRTIQIYPNPSDGLLNIKVDEACNVEVIDITGKIINTMRVDGISAIKIVTPGVYFLRFSNANGTGVQRVVVK